MKKTIYLLLSLLFVAGIQAQNQSTVWKKVYPAVLKQIKEPKFKNTQYNIRDFGAIANDTAVLNTEAINRAIATCSLNGGGMVVVPAGTWHTAPITLKSNVNLHVQEGATILFTTNPKYFPVVLTRWEGMDCYNLQPLIYAYGETNIAITGKGILDGGAGNENWWKKCGAVRYGWKEGDISQRTGRPKLMKWNNDKVLVSRRILTEKDGMRPQMLNFYMCNNVLIEGVKMLRSPFWVIHPLLCNNVTVRGVTVENDGPNGDGCDPESCRNVLIANCFFNTGDDCIAIKSGRNNDGRLWSRPSENIIVRNCEMKNGHGGVVIGSEITGGYKNLFVENCNMDSPLLDRVIRIKTNILRGGTIENIFVRNIKVGECKEAVLHINLLYEPDESGERGFIPVVRNINLDNVISRKSNFGVYIDALQDQTCVQDIFVSNCQFDHVKNGNHFKGMIENVKFENVKINGQLTEAGMNTGIDQRQ
ncbi:MAG: glycoside hydrolase family 28 protein [Paludibacteraceae bacterium]